MKVAIDSSALVAIVLGEPDADYLLKVMAENESIISAVSRLEASIVVETKQGPDAKRDLDLLVQGTNSQIIPFDDLHASSAFAAWLRFGKGRHPAALNFGDCATYATAKLADVPLLFKGNDFSQTDLKTL